LCAFRSTILLTPEPGLAEYSLTGKQQAVLEYVQRYMDAHRRSPLLREIQSGCAIASYKSVVDRLNALERKGYIRRAPNKHRGIEVLRGVGPTQPATREHPARPRAVAPEPQLPSLEAARSMRDVVTGGSGLRPNHPKDRP
jgi:SOS-response transcriptional repressor LexA